MKIIKNFLAFMGVLILYLIYSSFIILVLSKVGFDIETLSAYDKSLMLIIIELTLMLILYIIYNKELHKELIKFFKHLGKYFKFGFKWWLFGLIIMIVSNYFIGSYYGQSNNEVAVQGVLKEMPVYMIFAACIAAPFCEEIIFRKALRKWIPINSLFIILSGLIFGALHIVSGVNEPGQLLHIIPYATFGCIFAYMYVKTKNIFVSMTFHFLHNTFLILLSLLVLGVI